MEKYKEIKEFENALQEADDCPDLVCIDNIFYTMDEYDEEGKEISFGNKKYNKGFVVKTEDRYKNGFNDAVVEVFDCGCLRNDICYYE